MNLSFAVLAEDQPGIIYAFKNSDLLGQSVVVLLICMSVWAWWTMIRYGLNTYRALKMSERFVRVFNNQETIIGPLQEAQRYQCPVTSVYMEGMEKLLNCYFDDPEEAVRFITRPPVRGGAGAAPAVSALTGAQIESIEIAMEREVSSQIMKLEEGVPWLGTIVTLSPFLGLFGTVWGVMYAFCGVAIAGRPDFAALAPGVAGALLTTVAGLLVAIPSLIGYNWLLQKIRKVTVYMDNFTEEFMARVKNEQLAANRPRYTQSQNDGDIY